MIHESVEGERFATVAPTPRLRRSIEAAAEALRHRVPASEVRVGDRLDLGPGTSLIPTIWVGSGRRPDLVVEFRVESTSRYVLGPKRLGYLRGGAPDFWYVDPWRRRVAVLRSAGPSRLEYTWPPAQRGPGEELRTEALEGPLSVDELLAGWPADVGHEPDPGESWWEEG